MSYVIVRTTRTRRHARIVRPAPRTTGCQCSACQLERSLARYRRVQGQSADRILRVRCRRRIPKLHVNLGRLRGLIYSSSKGRRGKPRTYIHFMRHEPWLTCDARGRQLYILGGRYRVTRRGIEG